MIIITNMINFKIKYEKNNNTTNIVNKKNFVAYPNAKQGVNLV